MRQLLSLCARDTGSEPMYGLLEQALGTFARTADDASWQRLLHEAEQQGIAALLHKHLAELGTSPVPRCWRRLLHSLALRSRHANLTRNHAMAQILAAYDAADIRVLLVKGIALANSAYSEPGLRAMRDIDLLVGMDQIQQARDILGELGWATERHHDIPDDYYHLPPMVRLCDSLPVTIELHGYLLPLHGGYPRWPLEKSWDAGANGQLDGRLFRTLSLEETLYHVYLHGLQAPLTYEPLRLIHVADLVTLTEKYLEDIQWEQLRTIAPTLPAVLSRLHFLTPLRGGVLDRLGCDVSRKPAGIGLPYAGWPCRRPAKVAGGELWRLARDTLWPAEWWLQVYHGRLSGPGYWQARLLEHPRLLWRWVKAFRKSKKIASAV